MADTLTVDIDGWSSDDVAALVQYIAELREGDTPQDADWHDADSTGWTKKHLDQLRKLLAAGNKTVQLKAFERAIENGGYVSRQEVYEIGAYPPARKLNNWLRPLDAAAELLEQDHGLPHDADWPMVADYGPGNGWRPAKGFRVPAEIVKLAHQS